MSIIERQQAAARAKTKKKKKAEAASEAEADLNPSAGKKENVSENCQHLEDDDGGEAAVEAAEDIAEPTILEQFAADKANFEETKLPKWLYKYLVFRFNLLDRTG